MVDGWAGSTTREVMLDHIGRAIGTCLQWAAPSVDLKIFAGVSGWPVGSVAAYTVSAVVGSTATAETKGPTAVRPLLASAHEDPPSVLFKTPWKFTPMKRVEGWVGAIARARRAAGLKTTLEGGAQWAPPSVLL